MPSYRPRRTRFIGKRRTTGWEVGPHTGFTPLIYSSQQVLPLSKQIGVATQFIDDGMTLTRVRGEITCFMAVPSALYNASMGAAGMFIMDSAAFAFGAAAALDPIDDAASEDWLWHQYMPMSPIGAAVEFQNQGTQAFRWTIDSRAQRKVNAGDLLVLVMSHEGLGAGALVFMAGSRVLLKMN